MGSGSSKMKSKKKIEKKKKDEKIKKIKKEHNPLKHQKPTFVQKSGLNTHNIDPRAKSLYSVTNEFSDSSGEVSDTIENEPEKPEE